MRSDRWQPGATARFAVLREASMSSSVKQGIPYLLPAHSQPRSQDVPSWTPTKYLTPLQPPPPDIERLEQEAAAQKLGMDGRAIKKAKPRRTVDYMGGMGRLSMLRKTRPNGAYIPYMRPNPSAIIDLLPPKAYPENASTSLCTKFVHTSTNKIRYPVNLVTWTPEARRVLTGSTSGEMTLWNGLTFNFETILQAHDGAIRAMRFSHSGAFLISSDQAGVIKYFQPNMNNVAAWQGHREAVRSLSFSPDDKRFVSASDDSKLRIWTFEEMREERTLTGHGWDVRCVEWHPSKGLLASGSKDNLVKFWDPRTSQCLSTVHYHKNTIQALAWSPNGDMLATASRDQSVRVFDIRAMKEYMHLKGHKKEVCSVAWHPVHHNLLVSGGSEGSILHWCLTGSSPATPRASVDEAHESNVWCLAFHPLGHLLVSASNDHTTRFWSRERPNADVGEWKSGAGVTSGIAEGDEEEDEGYVPGLSMAYNAAQEGFTGGEEGYGYDSQPGAMGVGEDDFIPGFGGGVSRKPGPSQDVPYAGPGGGVANNYDFGGQGGTGMRGGGRGGFRRGGFGGGRGRQWY